jgi:ABC-2 type transport system ATP-binding protein
MSVAITAEGLEKSYGRVRALDGLDITVEEGTVLGLLGPNGAGKTTAVRVLTTLLRPDAGRASVAGYDVVADAAALRAFADADSLPARHPVALSLAFSLVVLLLFVPLAVRRYRAAASR